MQTTHTSKSQSRGKSHVSHAKNERDMQREIDELKKKLRRARRRRLSPESESSSGETDDDTYRRQSRTPPSETFSVKNKRNIVAISARIRAQRIRALETEP